MAVAELGEPNAIAFVAIVVHVFLLSHVLSQLFRMSSVSKWCRRGRSVGRKFSEVEVDHHHLFPITKNLFHH